ncbi:MAG TPA: winged helix-turn-helix domain-containing protein, partial [Burkholderiaceae bacterium]|nr:winged helix-turn-helix domain-containing protein [Burkholderiaceae bacterium]
MNFPDSPSRHPGALAARFAFGEVTFNPLRRAVWRLDGTPVPLSPRALDALELFVVRPGELIDKDTLMRALWPSLVVEENSLSQVISALRRALGDDGKRYIQTEARRGFRFIAKVTERDGAASPAPNAAASLAVLPFASLAPESQDRLLEIGMADSLIARLSTVPGLCCRSVGSVHRFAGPNRDLAQAAQALEAAWILDGTLQQAGGRLRVNVRLLSMPSQMAAWSGSFNTEFTNVFDVQDVISERVAHALAASRGGQAPWAPAAARLGGTRNVDAYQLYLAAKQQAQGYRADGLNRSIELCQQALAVDPGYALAHVGIARAAMRMIFSADREPREAMDTAREHVLAALKLAPDLAEAHAQLAHIEYWYDHEWELAERTFVIALTLDPNAAFAHFGLGHLLATVGRQDEALLHMRTARELDPTVLMYQTAEGVMTADSGHVAAGRARLERVLQIDPTFWFAHYAVGTLALAAGDPETSIAAQRRAEDSANGSSLPTAQLGVGLARAGRRKEARAVLARLEAIAAQRYLPPTLLAMVYAALGDTAAALDALERA